MSSKDLVRRLADNYYGRHLLTLIVGLAVIGVFALLVLLIL